MSNEKIRKVFSENLLRILDNQSLKQVDLADMMGVSKQLISDWVNGRTYPRPKNMQQIADNLNVNITDLISEYDVSISEYAVPILGSASCGYGAINESPEEYIDLEEHMFKGIRNRDNCFFMYACGKSMERAGVHDGALLLLNRQETLENGEVGLFTWNNEEYLKRFKRQGDVIMLLSETNEEGHEPIIVLPDDQFVIRAKLLKCITNFE